MTRRAQGAGVFAEALLLGLVVSVANAADPPAAPTPRQNRRIQLFQARDLTSQARDLDGSPPLVPLLAAPLPHRFKLELAGARTNAEDFLHDAGFSLLEDHDFEGRRSYTLLSGSLADAVPRVRVQARFGRPEVAGGLRLAHNSTSLGVSIPMPQYVIEFEGVNNRSAGYGLLGSVRWHDAQNRIQYGIALPIATKGAAVGVLFQIGCKLN